jgi:hypothetical protein
MLAVLLSIHVASAHLLGLFMFTFGFALAVPTPVKALAIAAAVYGILQAAKVSPWLGQYVAGWWALLINAALTILAFWLTIPSTQLYTWGTLTATIVTILGSAGIHGSVQKLVLPAPPPATSALSSGSIYSGPAGSAQKSVPPLVKAIVLVSLISFTLLPLCAFSCSGSQQLQAAKASLQASTVIATAQQVEIALHQQSLETDAEHQFIEQQFDDVGQIGTAADACIGSASQKNGVFTCLNTAIAKLDAMNAQGGLELKSVQAKGTFETAIAGVRGVLASIEATLGGTPPVAAVTTAN